MRLGMTMPRRLNDYPDLKGIETPWLRYLVVSIGLNDYPDLKGIETEIIRASITVSPGLNDYPDLKGIETAEPA